MTDGFALKSWVVDLINKAFKKNGLRYNGIPVELQYPSTAIDLAEGNAVTSLIPVMTDYTSPSGKVTSTGDWDGCDAYRAFKAIASESGYFPINGYFLNSWCQYESESPITFNTIIATSDDPFKLQYDIMVSNDGKSWATVGTIPIDDYRNISNKKWNVLNIPSTTAKFIRFKCITNISDHRGSGIWIKIYNSKLSKFTITATPVYETT